VGETSVKDIDNLCKWERYYGGLEGEAPDYFYDGELAQLAALRAELFEKYLGGIAEVSEFGAGTGHNLLPLLNTGRRLRAFDWSSVAVKRAAAAGLEAQVFDMKNPDFYVPLNGATITVHALEQLGRDWEQFFLYLLIARPTICIHIEPIEELYNHTRRDLKRRAYHLARGYLYGYFTELECSAKKGEAELLEVRKSPFGGKDHDAYSVIVWRPL